MSIIFISQYSILFSRSKARINTLFSIYLIFGILLRSSLGKVMPFILLTHTKFGIGNLNLSYSVLEIARYLASNNFLETGWLFFLPHMVYHSLKVLRYTLHIILYATTTTT